MSLIKKNAVDQSRSHVARDQIGGDQVNIHNHFGGGEAAAVSSQVQTLFKKLVRQRERGESRTGFISDLEIYVETRSTQTVVGLKEKLERVGRGAEFDDAVRKKELFSKKLLSLQHWEAAQELFAYFLSMIQEAFDRRIIPCCDTIDRAQLEQIIGEHITDKILSEIGAGDEALIVNHALIQGMIFWLADKCFVRWHR
ncbi:ABC-three component system protein [Aestuariivirga sp.]|uniref:ABC-three component system protein n=1 Tax=Aestuariivirga sp. TaxID=2650926 RepID=UPI0039E31637